jgi:PST family polysaccharide transporter
MISKYKNDTMKINQIYTTISVIKVCLLILSFITLVSLLELVQISNRNLYYFGYLSVLTEIIFPTWLFQGFEKMGFLSITNFIGRLIGFSLILMFINTSSPIYYVFIFEFAGVLVSGFISQLVIFKILKISFIKININLILIYFKEGFDLFVAQLSTSLLSNINIILLKIFTNDLVVGIYGTGERIVRLIVSLISPISSSLFPRFSSLLSISYKNSIEWLNKITVVLFFSFLLISFSLFVFSDFIVFLVTGEFMSSVSLVVKILSFMPLFILLNNIYGTQFMINLNEERAFKRLILLSSLSIFIMSLILIPFFSEVGAAISSIFAEFVLVSSMVFYVEKKYKLGYLFLWKK